VPKCAECLEKAKYDVERINGSSIYVCSLSKHKLRLTGNYRKIKEIKMNLDCMSTEDEDEYDIDCMSPIDKASELRALYKEYTRFSDLLSSLEDDGYTIDMSSEEYIKIYKEI